MIWQTVAVMIALVIVAGYGYSWRRSQLRNQSIDNASPTAPLGDLSGFQQIAKDTLGLVYAGELSRAKSRVGDLEFAWDNAEARIKPMNPGKWSSVDDSIDDVLRKLRAVRQDATACTESLKSLIAVINPLNTGEPNKRQEEEKAGRISESAHWD